MYLHKMNAYIELDSIITKESFAKLLFLMEDALQCYDNFRY